MAMNATRGLLAFFLPSVLALSCGAGMPASSPSMTPASTPSPAASPTFGDPASPRPCTEFGREAWTDYARYPDDGLQDLPGTDFYVGAWTRVLEPMGYPQNSNDYPFIIPCAQSVGGQSQLILTISGNIGYDGGAGSWAYNQNITSNTGDYSTVYVHPGRFEGYPAGRPDEADMRGWVYVAWHFARSAAGTVVNQYCKFGPSGAVIRSPVDVIDGTGVFDGSAPSPLPEYATPLAICVGGGDRGWATTYMQYAKVYLMGQAPSAAEVDAISRRTSPDPAAWADWPLAGGDLSDVSGHGRDLVMRGSAYPGPDGPALVP
jgi:hypothetical protein